MSNIGTASTFPDPSHRGASPPRPWQGRRRGWAIVIGVAVLVAAGVLVAVATSSPSKPGVAPAHGGQGLTVAFTPGSVPTSVFPFYSASQCTTTNIDYWNLEVRPGYWFGLGSSVALIPSLSPLNLPTFAVTGANTTITFTTKGWTWSNGTGQTAAMDAKDIAFFLNMDKAQTGQGANAFCGYAPHFGVPDQIVKVSYPHGLTGNEVSIVFAGHPSHQWLQYNELSQIVPLTQAWDTTGSPANCAGESFASVKTNGSDPCTAVFKYLSSLQINDSIWAWADGPYRQQSAQYSSGVPDGNDVQVANTEYSGAVKAHAVQTITYKPYATTGAEVADLQSGKLDLGYAEPSDVSPSPSPGLAGRNLLPHMSSYNTVGTTEFGVFYYMFNFDNAHSTYQTSGLLPTWAKLNNLQYFREAMQTAENQAFVITHVDNGYAIQTFSAIPTYPKNSLNQGVVNPYPYSASEGKALMRAHGWNTSVFPDTCAAANCGTAQFPIPTGAKASISLLVPSGDPAVTQQTNDEDTFIKDGSGIQVVPVFEPATSVQGACFGGSATWQLCGYGGWIYAPDYYPSGEVLFAAGSSSNSGGYANNEMNELIRETTTDGNLALNATDATNHTSFAQWSATDVPFLWQPTPPSFIEQLRTIKGIQPPNPLSDFNPEYITAI
jgi:peptide/nickel transport system substrate-binding protein